MNARSRASRVENDDESARATLARRCDALVSKYVAARSSIDEKLRRYRRAARFVATFDDLEAQRIVGEEKEEREGDCRADHSDGESALPSSS